MKFNTAILNVQDYRDARIRYLSELESTVAVYLRCCPMCEANTKWQASPPKSMPWYIIIRRNLRAMTIRCKVCHFQFTFTYHNLIRGRKGFIQAAIDEGIASAGDLAKWEQDKIELDRFDLEKRGKAKVV